ncbi:MAG: rubrerythrin family protein [Clostridia bacterium]|nr:rubrerythrin family protein [Clostridia bacterium]
MKFEQSETVKNLRTAFLAESGAMNEYNFFATQAKNEGLEYVAKTLNVFALNEKAHAEVWFKLYHGISCTTDNLRSSAELENYERTVMYEEFRETAEKEGFKDIARLFSEVAEIEGAHERTYLQLKKKLDDGKLLEGKADTVWKCLNCGHIHKGKTPPENCPVCSHPKGFFSVIQGDNS